MSEKLKLIFYYNKIQNCKCIDELLKDKFDIHTEVSETSLGKTLQRSTADAIVFCFGSTVKNKRGEFRKIESLTGHLPLLPCTNRLDHDFFLEAVEMGIHKFLSPEMQTERIIEIVQDAINKNELEIFIGRIFPGYFEKSKYGKRIVTTMIRIFPQRLSEEEVSDELGISRVWIQRECKKAFNITYIQLARLLRVYQAARLMHRTHLDNNQIAICLNYSEESSMARDFRKVLHLSPTEARKKLFDYAPDRLFDFHNNF